MIPDGNASTEYDEMRELLEEAANLMPMPHTQEMRDWWEKARKFVLNRTCGGRMIIDSNDIDSYGQYTVERWFSNGEKDKENETYEQRGCGKSLTIMSMGLAGETGEVMEKIKKLFRDGTFDEDNMKKELGDVVFYWARICKYFGWEPSDIIAANVDKLEGRVVRGTMRGSGDNR